MTSGDSPIAIEQARSAGQTAPALLAAHLIASGALLRALPGPAGELIMGAIGALLAADLLLALFALIRPRSDQSRQAAIAHGAVSGLCSGVLVLALPAEAGTAAFLPAGAIVLVTWLGLASAPKAAALAGVVPVVAAIVRAPDPMLAAMLLAFAACLAAMAGLGTHYVRRNLREGLGGDALDQSAVKAERLLAEFEESGRGWFWEIDAGGRLTYISPPLAEAIGTTPEAMLGTHFSELIVNENDSAEEGHASRGERTLGFHLSTRLAFSDVAVRAAAEGDARWWSLSGRPAFDAGGNFIGFRGSGTDLTEMRRSEAEINKLARYDPLTGLPNRILMRQTLEEMLHDKAGRTRASGLFLLDLDRFKMVNDTLGHPVGDALLRQVAVRLEEVIAESGRVGRLGGDEFIVVLPGIEEQGRLSITARAVIEKLSQPYVIEGVHVTIGASIGIAVAPRDGATADALVRNADLALYAAKADGKGVHRFYEARMHASAKDRRLLEIDLRKAIGDGELHLSYQPVVSASTEQITGFEALARWNHPTRGPVSPSDFIPIAEEIGLIPQIGEWVLRTACKDAAGWPDTVRVAVNISPIQFVNPALPGIVLSALAEAQLPPHRLELEITEGVFLNDDEATDAMFAKLKAIGVRFALDDFGTGYSSLGYLKKAPFNKIKIDQSFVRGAAVDGSRNAAIIRAIVTLAESLDMETTAEGAETHEELELIRGLGCSHIQGYIFGKPMLAGEAAERVGVTERGVGHLAPREPRVAVLRSATLIAEGRSYPTKIRNLSESGAMIESNQPLAPGTAVEITLPDGTHHKGAVRWAQEDRFGVVFERRFELEKMTTQQPKVAQGGRRARG